MLRKVITYMWICAVGFFIAACSSDVVIHKVEFPPEAVIPDRAINFDMKSGNVTRSITPMDEAGHYEFGVFASQNAPFAAADAGVVMDNYLVAYGPNLNYAPWLSWLRGDDYDADDDIYSHTSWIYTYLGNNDPMGPPYNVSVPMTKSVQPQQISKYWDSNTNAYYFYAYAPYMPVGDAYQPATVSISNSSDGENIYFNGLRAFYTDPVEQTGIVTGAHTQGGYDAGKDISGNTTELLNANEALYAGNSLVSDSYLGDVSLIFKHVNAKVRIAFWEDIPGYTVNIIDLIPEGVHDGHNCDLRPYQGIAFTPATEPMTAYPDPQTPKYQLATYYNNAQVRVKGIAPQSVDNRTNFKSIEVGDASVDNVTRNNLRFLVNGETLAESREGAAYSPTVYYPLPNSESTLATPGYITDVRDGKQVGSETGYTVHVSYVMHPVDGSVDITVYDARVYIPAEKCRWEAGKQYTYLFRITPNGNGTTNPDMPDPTDPDEPWVDPDDPRIPDFPALAPIVFDGVQVEDYETNTIHPDFTF